MSKEDEYEDYSDEEDGDDIHAECLSCGTLNRFPGKDIPKILCYECGEIIVANQEPPPKPEPTPTPASPTTQPQHQVAPAPVAVTPAPAQSGKEKAAKKKSIFGKKKNKEKKKNKIPGNQFSTGDGNPAITAPVFVKHVSGATQSDDLAQTENGLLSGNRPDPSLPVDVERKSKAMDIPIGVEQKPLIGGLDTVTAPTNVRKNPDPLSSIQQGGKPKKLNKEEKKQAKEKEKEEKRMKKVYEKEAKKFAKSGVVLEKRKFPSATPPASAGGATPSSPPSSPTMSHANPTPTPPPAAANPVPEENLSEEGPDDDEVSEFCSNCGSLNVFPPGADRVACYECDTPIVAPTAKGNQDSYDEDDEDEITDVCPSCGTLNAFPSENVPQIACYNCGSPIDNPKVREGEDGEDDDDDEDGELQSFCSKCGSLNIFPPGVFAVACWECENPIYYNT